MVEYINVSGQVANTRSSDPSVIRVQILGVSIIDQCQTLPLFTQTGLERLFILLWILRNLNY